jgi:pimeloyl-ACP methyl ester carboxylesterase
VNERFVDVGNGVTLCYETFGDASAPPLLLVMGLGMQMVGWPDEFCTELAARGFHVVRFDNRDVGRSTCFESVPRPSVWRLLTRRFASGQYRLTDMAADAAGLLRELGLAPAHVVGVSLGGMIAQTLAAEHPQAVRSLVSIMSTTGHRRKGQPAPSMLRMLFRRTPHDRQSFVEYYVATFVAIGSPGFPPDREQLRADAERAYERLSDPNGTSRQLAAIVASGNRGKQLAAVKAPTLVVHGTGDRLVRPSGGRETAKRIPGARLVTIEGMGHDLPRAKWPELIELIASHAHAADAARASAAA